MFHNDKRLTTLNYQACLWDLAHLEIQMGQSARPRKIAYLDADPKTLWTRIKNRDGNIAPDLSWFKDTRRKFDAPSGHLPNCTRLHTDELSEAEVTDKVLTILTQGSKSTE